MSQVFLPVYKDTFFEAAVPSLTFYVMADDQIIFQGKATRAPGETRLRININKIAKDYLEHTLPEFTEEDGVVLPNKGAFKIFELYRTDGTLLETYGVLFDWEGEFAGNTTVLTDPIKPNISVDMKFPFTIYSPSGETTVLFATDDPSLQFTNNTPVIIFTSNGGTSEIHFGTTFDLSDLTVSATTTGYTLGPLGVDSVSVTSSENLTMADKRGEIVFLYRGMDIGLARTQVVTLKQGTPVTGITWESGETVNRFCWYDNPFANDPIIYIPEKLDYEEPDYSYSNTEKTWSSLKRDKNGNTFIGSSLYNDHLSCVLPYDFVCSDDWFRVGVSGGSVNIIAEDNPQPYQSQHPATREGTITTYLNGVVQSVTTVVQIIQNRMPYEYDAGIVIGPFSAYSESIIYKMKNEVYLYNIPDFMFDKVYPDGSRFQDYYAGYWGSDPQKRNKLNSTVSMTQGDGGYYVTFKTRYPVNGFGVNWNISNSGYTFEFHFPSDIKYAQMVAPSGITFHCDGTRENLMKSVLLGYVSTPGGQPNGDLYIHTTDGLLGIYWLYGDWARFSEYDEVCNSCSYGSFAYEYTTEPGYDSNYVIYSGETLAVDSMEVYDKYMLPLNVVSESFDSGTRLGTIVYDGVPFAIKGAKARYIRSDSAVVFNPGSGVYEADVPRCQYYAGSMTENRILYLRSPETVAIIAARTNSTLIVPNAKYISIGESSYPRPSNVKLFIPSATRLSCSAANSVTELTIGPMLNEIKYDNVQTYTVFNLLTEINFNATSSVFNLWVQDNYKVLKANQFPNLDIVHTLDADLNNWYMKGYIE